MVVVTNNPETEPMINRNDGQSVNNNKKDPLTETDAYKTITSSMRADPLQIESPKTALQLLTTAIQLQNMPLVNECIKNLDQQLNKEDVLMILQHLSKCKIPSTGKSDFEPSAPPIIESENQRESNWLGELLRKLKHNCLLVIDKEADYVLKKKEMMDLNYSDIYDILSRDTLEVSSEVVVYTVVYNWGLAECNRMTLNTQHLQEVLRQLRYLPRYGLMNKKEFCSGYIGMVKGPTKSEVLDEADWRLIKFYIEQKAKHRSVNDLPHKMSSNRYIGKEKPYGLSCKSMSRYESTTKTRRNSMPAKHKCEGCFINFLSCWTAVFD